MQRAQSRGASGRGPNPGGRCHCRDSRKVESVGKEGATGIDSVHALDYDQYAHA